MKKLSLLFIGLLFGVLSVNAQDEKESPFSVSADFVNRYIFRGLDFGESPAIQPGIDFTTGGLTIGAWGSYAFVATELGIEADLYASYAFDFGLSVGITDYYFPGEQLILRPDNVIAPQRSGSYFDYKNYHFFELNVSQEIGDFYIAGNMFISDNMNSDLYFEAGYSFGIVDVFAGAGNEAYTMDGSFNLVNVGLTVSKEIKISEYFSLPVYGSLILNPDAEQIHYVVGFTL